MSFSANQSRDYVAGRETRMKTKKKTDLKKKSETHPNMTFTTHPPSRDFFQVRRHVKVTWKRIFFEFETVK